MQSEFNRRTLLAGGLAVTALSGLSIPLAQATPIKVAEPRIYSTKEWGARPATGPIEIDDHKPTYIVVHHTVEPGNTDDYSKESAFAAAKTIQDLHIDRRGWIDSGQQFTISRGGYILEGRHRSLEILRGGKRHVQGSNVANHNSEVIGIENEGLYNDVDVPGKLWNSLVDFVAYIACRYDISPEFIKGHRDFNSSTQCPGHILYDRLPELRLAVAAKLA